MAYTRYLASYVPAGDDEPEGPEAHGTVTTGGAAYLRAIVPMQAHGTVITGGTAEIVGLDEGNALITQAGLEIDVQVRPPLNVTVAAFEVDLLRTPPVNITSAALMVDIIGEGPVEVTQAGVMIDVHKSVPIEITQIGAMIDSYTRPSPRATNCVEIRIEDLWGNTLAILENAFGIEYMDALNTPGGGRFQVYANDYKITRNISGVDYIFKAGNRAKLYYKGEQVGGFVIEHWNEVLACESEVAGRIVNVDGRGFLGRYLDKALVYPNDLANVNELVSSCTWNDATIGQIFRDLWDGPFLSTGDERTSRVGGYITRGGNGNLDAHSFDAEHDSSGKAWGQTIYQEFRAGITLLDVMNALAPLGAEFRARPDGRLECYQAACMDEDNNLLEGHYGRDLTETVVFRKGWNIVKAERDNSSVDQCTCVLATDGENLWIETKALGGTPGYEEFGRIEATLPISNVASQRNRMYLASNNFLALYARPRDAIRLTVTTDRLFPFYTYDVGDTVQVDIPYDPPPNRYSGNYRILSIALKERTGPCDLVAELELNSLRTEYLLRVEKAMRASFTMLAATTAAAASGLSGPS